ncbi:hypothetical protein CBS101457_003524 [Exobasidium rhododendri]|nr:hypothetical protein CBS101457_003524 [Exobasidium rhododendri]
MSATVLVPGSPTSKANVSSTLERRYRDQRQDAFHGSLLCPKSSSSGVGPRHPAPASRQFTSFVASSARATRIADLRTKKRSDAAKQMSKFGRNTDAGFEDVVASSTPHTMQDKGDELGQKRDDSLRLVEDLAIGPKTVEPSDDDQFFLKLEPTSRIALRKRYILHNDFNPHLEGRYYLPISTLYSVAVPGKSDDGDFTLPVDGDWLTMGVVTAKSDTRMTKGKYFDANGRIIDGDKEPQLPFGEASSATMAHNDTKQATTSGLKKMWAPKRFFILTLTDLSEKPDKFGEHDGSRELELVVFESDSTWLEVGGERRYSGGSCGAFEKLSSANLGTLICVMNPKISTSKFHGKERNVLRLSPRAGKTILLVGMAANYGTCSAMACQNFVDRRTRMDVCSFHLDNQLNRTRNGRSEVQSERMYVVMASWRQNSQKGPPYAAKFTRNSSRSINHNSPYALSDGLAMGSKGREVCFETDDSLDPSDCTSRRFDVCANYGRAKEARFQQDEKAKELLELQRRMHKTIPETSKNQTSASTVDAFGKQVDGERRLEMLLRRKNIEDAKAKSRESSTSVSTLDSILAAETAGSKVIEAARKAMQEKKREAEKALQKQAQDCSKSLGKGRKRSVAEMASEGETEVPSGSYKAVNGDIKILSHSSSKLLARHSADVALLARPILRRKKVKLPPNVRPPPGESFYASESSDEELEGLIRSGALAEHLQESEGQFSRNATLSIAAPGSDSESDLEIVPSTA